MNFSDYIVITTGGIYRFSYKMSAVCFVMDAEDNGISIWAVCHRGQLLDYSF